VRIHPGPEERLEEYYLATELLYSETVFPHGVQGEWRRYDNYSFGLEAGGA
jgi:hypothetical protein